MDELSLYVLDITMNSVRAGATDIRITLTEENGTLTLTVTDNGCGMTEEQVRKLSDPFYTTRSTRKVGLGVPFLKMLAEMTGGSVEVRSVPKGAGEDHGTEITATFGLHHIDFIPLGNIADTIVTLIQGSPEVDFRFRHLTEDGKEISFDTREVRAVLGDISLAEPEILQWIRENITEQYDAPFQDERK